ncbi:MAG: sodium:proton antiporter [Nitrospiraceae bacterium]|nr:sodium:proton antiporter [Nitrospiraceae bacterium]
MIEQLGERLALWSAMPFAGMLLSIAFFPLFAPKFWHDHFGKVSAFWAAAVVIPLLLMYKGVAYDVFLRIVAEDYVPFIILLGGLFVVSGGILITGTLRGTPAVNTGILLIGTFLASVMGTTGAAMFLIRPLIRANAYRENRTLVVVFFIFLVANIGGALTPLGDPPLFLGFLMGVPFFWTLRIFAHLASLAGVLLGLYFLMDSYCYKKEKKTPLPENNKSPLGIKGAQNLIFLLGIIGAVIFSGSAHLGSISIGGLSIEVRNLIRDLAIIVMALCSMIFTPRQVREENSFSWLPFKEVVILFAGLFITMAPCLLILQAGSRGCLGPAMSTFTEPYHYFWATGLLSSFLDNSPTYLAFLKASLGRFYSGAPDSLAISSLLRDRPIYLQAVSEGAVFFGAVTYIGNAPNFMVRSISEEQGVRMPGFLGYMVKYSLPLLVPAYLLVTLVFF